MSWISADNFLGLSGANGSDVADEQRQQSLSLERIFFALGSVSVCEGGSFARELRR
jgi:hypothetical protein